MDVSSLTHKSCYRTKMVIGPPLFLNHLLVSIFLVSLSTHAVVALLPTMVGNSHLTSSYFFIRSSMIAAFKDGYPIYYHPSFPSNGHTWRDLLLICKVHSLTLCFTRGGYDIVYFEIGNIVMWNSILYLYLSPWRPPHLQGTYHDHQKVHVCI